VLGGDAGGVVALLADSQQPPAGHPLLPVPQTYPSGQHTSVSAQ